MLFREYVWMHDDWPAAEVTGCVIPRFVLTTAFHWWVNTRVLYLSMKRAGCMSNTGDWCQMDSLPDNLAQRNWSNATGDVPHTHTPIQTHLCFLDLEWAGSVVLRTTKEQSARPVTEFYSAKYSFEFFQATFTMLTFF